MKREVVLTLSQKKEKKKKGRESSYQDLKNVVDLKMLLHSGLCATDHYPERRERGE